MSSKLGPVQKRAWVAVLLGYNRIAAEIDRRLKGAGMVSLDVYDILLALEMADGRLKMNELASKLILSTSGITRAVDRLEKEGFIERAMSQEDRRAVWAQLTPKGLAERERAWPTYEAAIQELFGQHMSSEEAGKVLEVFERML